MSINNIVKLSSQLLSLEELRQLLSFVGALDVLSDANLGFLVRADGSGQLELSLSVKGINFAIEALEQLDDSGLVGGQFTLGLGHDVADQKFAAVSNINGSNGIKKWSGDEAGGYAVSVTTATMAQIGQDQGFFGQG